jgi:hypothetical protein
LLDAGVDPEEIGHLVFRLAFETIVSEGRDAVATARELVAGRSTEIRAAWNETMRRMVMVSD